MRYDDKPCVMLAIKPHWVDLIFDGTKAVEVRKRAPDLAPPYGVYVYESERAKAVVGEFVCDKTDDISVTEKGVAFRYFGTLHDSCLTLTAMREYLGSGGSGKGLYITQALKYDKPVPIGSFKHICPGDCGVCKYREPDTWGSYVYDEPRYICGSRIKRAPQNFLYCEKLF